VTTKPDLRQDILNINRIVKIKDPKILIKDTRVNWAPVAHTCNPSFWEAEIRRVEVEGQPGQIVQEIVSRKNPMQVRTGIVAQVECLPCKREALSSNPSTQRKKQKREEGCGGNSN
jgi:hypothetical protein